MSKDGQQPLAEVIRSIYLERETGALELTGDGARVELFFRGGELYLDRFDQRAAGLDAGKLDAAGPRPAGDADLRYHAEELARELAGRDGAARFDRDPRKLPQELAGPLPTVCLVMELAVADLDERQLVERLGGERVKAVSCSETPALEQLPGLDPEMAPVLARLERPVAVAELVRGGDRLAVLRGLAKLRAVGLAKLAEGGPSAAPAGAGLVSGKLLGRFSKRIGEALETRPIELPVQEHRELIADLLSRLGELNHYRLLGLEPKTPAEEIYPAFERLAKRVHPGHAARLGFADRAEPLNVLFERAVEAYLTLSDPRRRSSYHVITGIRIETAIDERQRAEEKRQLAARQYRQGTYYLSTGEYSTAVDLLKEAARLDPRPEYLAALAQAQSKNPHWRRHAVDSYRRAVAIEPADPGIRAGFGALLEEMGQVEAARTEYQAALDAMPGHPGALEALERLRHGRAS